MPDTETLRLIENLQTAINGLARRLDAVVRDLAAVKAQTPPATFERLAAAVERQVAAANQFGQLLSSAEPLQATRGQPKNPWKDV